jgi:hypothetical protein
MSYEFYFKKLRKLTLKQISTEHHVSNFRAYIANNIIPKGLHIKLTPQSTGFKCVALLYIYIIVIVLLLIYM